MTYNFLQILHNLFLHRNLMHFQYFFLRIKFVFCRKICRNLNGNFLYLLRFLVMIFMCRDGKCWIPVESLCKFSNSPLILQLKSHSSALLGFLFRGLTAVRPRMWLRCSKTYYGPEISLHINFTHFALSSSIIENDTKFNLGKDGRNPGLCIVEISFRDSYWGLW